MKQTEFQRIEKKIESAVETSLRAFESHFLELVFNVGGALEEARAICEDAEYCKRIGLEGKLPNNRFNNWLKSDAFTIGVIPKLKQLNAGASTQTLLNFRNVASTLKGRFDQIKHVPAGALYRIASPSNDNVREHVIARIAQMPSVKIKEIDAIIEEEKETHKVPPTPQELASLLKKEIEQWKIDNDFIDFDKKTSTLINNALSRKVIAKNGEEDTRETVANILDNAQSGTLTADYKHLNSIYNRESRGMKCPTTDRDAMKAIFAPAQIEELGVKECEKRLVQIIRNRRDLQETINVELMGEQGIEHRDYEELYNLIAIGRLAELGREPCELDMRKKIDALKNKPKLDVVAAQDRILCIITDHIEAGLSLTSSQFSIIRGMCSIAKIREHGEAKCTDLVNEYISKLSQPPINQPPTEQPPIDQPLIDQPPIDQPPIEQATQMEVLGATLAIPTTKAGAYAAIGQVMLVYDDRDFAFSVLDALRDQAGDDDGLMEYLNHVEQCIK